MHINSDKGLGDLQLRITGAGAGSCINNSVRKLFVVFSIPSANPLNVRKQKVQKGENIPQKDDLELFDPAIFLSMENSPPSIQCPIEIK